MAPRSRLSQLRLLLRDEAQVFLPVSSGET